DGRVGADQEAGLLGGLDPLDGGLEDAVALYAQVVGLLQAVEVDVEEEAPAGAKLPQPLLDEHTVGAEVDVLFAAQDGRDELADLGVDQRLAAANADDGRAALVHRGQALGDGQLLLDRLRVFADAAAAGAGQVAGVQWLEHQNQGEALRAGDLLTRD